MSALNESTIEDAVQSWVQELVYTILVTYRN